MPQLTLKHLTKDVNDLPSLPMITLQVIKLTDDAKTTIPQISNVISQDQVMAAKILRMANSAYYGFARSISSITDAIIVLGFKSIRDLVFAATMHDFINKELSGYALAKGELWKHSIVCAMVAAKIAKRVHYNSPDEVFTAGLLHDIGKVILNIYMNDSFELVLQKVNDEKVPFMLAEKDILGFDHAAVGAAVANKWNLPETMVEAIAFHHKPLEAPHNKQLAALVHIADIICMTMGIGLGADGMLYPCDEGVLKLLKLKSSDIEELISETAENMVDITSLTDF